MTQAIVKQEAKELANATAADVSGMMEEMGISTGDLLVPRLFLMQNTSEAVGDGTAKLGDLVVNLTDEVIGGVSAPLELVPLKVVRMWRTYDISAGIPKYLHETSVTPQNEKTTKFESTDPNTGNLIRNYLNHNLYFLRKSEVDSGGAMPFIVAFKSTSLLAGKQLSTFMFNDLIVGRKPYARSYFLNVAREKKDTNTYAVMRIEKGQPLSDAATQEAETWVGRLKTMTVRVSDDKEDKHGEPKPVPAYVAKSDRPATVQYVTDDQLDFKY